MFNSCKLNNYMSSLFPPETHACPKSRRKLAFINTVLYRTFEPIHVLG